MARGAEVAGTALNSGAAIGTTIAAIGTAAAAANAVPIAGQVAAAALAIAAGLTKVFAGRRQRRAQRAVDRRAATANKIATNASQNIVGSQSLRASGQTPIPTFQSTTINPNPPTPVTKPEEVQTPAPQQVSL